MPRTKLSARSDAEKDLVRLIRAQSYAVFGSVNSAAPRCGMTRQTFAKRMGRVEKLTLGELRTIREQTRISKEELLPILERFL